MEVIHHWLQAWWYGVPHASGEFDALEFHNVLCLASGTATTTTTTATTTTTTTATTSADRKRVEI